MIADFRRRFWISLVLTIPVLVLDGMLRHRAGLGDAVAFTGDTLVQFILASAIYFYGGWPFLRGFVADV